MSYFGLENIFKVISIDNTPRKEKNTSHSSKSCQELTYTETLMAIRCDRVAEIKWFKSHDGHPWEPEGDCLVVLRDGTIRQSYVPINDVRAWFALENHNVETGVMSIQWKNGVNSPITVSPEIMNQIGVVAPILGVGIIFAVTQWVAQSKGDSDDREKIRKQKNEKKKRDRKEAIDARVIQSAYEMAYKGKSVSDITEMLKLYDVKIAREDIETLVSDAHTPSGRLRNQKLLAPSDDGKTIFFSDVAGIDEERYELEEIVTFFHQPEKFRTSGAKVPKGVLLCGPPGTGKTFLARAVAGESGASFLSVNASEFVEMFAGVGAARVRDLFSQARRLAPAIIFIDEIDAIGRPRGSGAGGTDERDQTLIQLLSLMDGFEAECGVILMAATNRKDVLDPALIRPGRFDRIITMGLPHQEGRVAILKAHLRGFPLETNLNITEIARECQGLAAAQLASLVNIAVSNSDSQENERLTSEDLFSALEYERLGPVRSDPLPPNLERRFALLESATAIAASVLPTIEEVWVLTILPRDNNNTGQTVLKLNQARHDFHVFTRNVLEDQLVMELAGRAAEIVLSCEEFSITNDERIANARRIVNKLSTAAMLDLPPSASFRTHYAMFEGPMRTTLHLMSSSASHIFMPEYDEIRHRKMEEGMMKAINLISRNRAALDEVTKTLLYKKKLKGTEVREIIKKTIRTEETKIKKALADNLT